jgi:hypothetical protein
MNQKPYLSLESFLDFFSVSFEDLVSVFVCVDLVKWRKQTKLKIMLKVNFFRLSRVADVEFGFCAAPAKLLF